MTEIKDMFINLLETFIAMQELDKDSDIYYTDDFGNLVCVDEEEEWRLQKEQAINKITDLINKL